ncbi:hypothetical protein LPJ61_001410, partial [Coemansia biformis]
MASWALRQYLLTEDEAGDLAGSGQAASSTGPWSPSDAGDGADGDGSGRRSVTDGSPAAGSAGSEPEVANPLLLSSGSITYDIYKWHRDYEREARPEEPSRARSLSGRRNSAAPSES